MYLRLEPGNGVPLGVQIASGLRLAIVTLRLRPGEQLPSARELAAQLNVNFHTVRKAYGELEAAGLLEFRRGLGTFVTAKRQARTGELRRVVRAHLQAMLEELASAHVDAGELAELVRSELQALLSAKRRA